MSSDNSPIADAIAMMKLTDRVESVSADAALGSGPDQQYCWDLEYEKLVENDHILFYHIEAMRNRIDCQNIEEIVESDEEEVIFNRILDEPMRIFIPHMMANFAIRAELDSKSKIFATYLTETLNEADYEYSLICTDSLIWYYEFHSHENFKKMIKDIKNKLSNGDMNLSYNDVCIYLCLIDSNRQAIPVKESHVKLIIQNAFFNNPQLFELIGIFDKFIGSNTSNMIAINYTQAKTIVNLLIEHYESPNMDLTSLNSSLWIAALSHQKYLPAYNILFPNSTEFNSILVKSKSWYGLDFIKHMKYVKSFSIYEFTTSKFATTYFKSFGDIYRIYCHYEINRLEIFNKKFIGQMWQLIKRIKKGKERAHIDPITCFVLSYMASDLCNHFVECKKMLFSNIFSNRFELFTSSQFLNSLAITIYTKGSLFTAHECLLLIKLFYETQLPIPSLLFNTAVTNFAYCILMNLSKEYPELFMLGFSMILENLNIYLHIDKIQNFIDMTNNFMERDYIHSDTCNIIPYSEVNHSNLFLHLLTIALGTFPVLDIFSDKLSIAKHIIFQSKIMNKCKPICCLLNIYTEMYKNLEMDDKINSLNSESFACRIILNLIQSELVCYHTVKALVCFIESQKDPKSIYDGIVLIPDSIWDCSKHRYTLISLICSCGSSQYIRDSPFKNIIFPIKYDSIVQWKTMFSKVPINTLIIAKYIPNLKNSNFYDLLENCKALISCSPFYRNHGWNIVAILSQFMDLRHKKLFIELLECLVKDILEPKINSRALMNIFYLMMFSTIFNQINSNEKIRYIRKIIEILQIKNWPIVHIIEITNSIMNYTDNFSNILKINENLQEEDNSTKYFAMKNPILICCIQIIEKIGSIFKSLCSQQQSILAKQYRNNDEYRINIFKKIAHIYTLLIIKYNKHLDTKADVAFENLLKHGQEISPVITFQCCSKIIGLGCVDSKYFDMVESLFGKLWKIRNEDIIIVIIDSIYELTSMSTKMQTNRFLNESIIRPFKLLLNPCINRHLTHFILMYLYKMLDRTSINCYSELSWLPFLYIDSSHFDPDFVWFLMKYIRKFSQYISNDGEIALLNQYASKLDKYDNNLLNSIILWRKELKNKHLYCSNIESSDVLNSIASKYSRIDLDIHPFYEFLSRPLENSECILIKDCNHDLDSVSMYLDSIIYKISDKKERNCDKFWNRLMFEVLSNLLSNLFIPFEDYISYFCHGLGIVQDLLKYTILYIIGLNHKDITSKLSVLFKIVLENCTNLQIQYTFIAIYESTLLYKFNFPVSMDFEKFPCNGIHYYVRLLIYEQSIEELKNPLECDKLCQTLQIGFDTNDIFFNTKSFAVLKSLDLSDEAKNIFLLIGLSNFDAANKKIRANYQVLSNIPDILNVYTNLKFVVQNSVTDFIKAPSVAGFSLNFDVILSALKFLLNDELDKCLSEVLKFNSMFENSEMKNPHNLFTPHNKLCFFIQSFINHVLLLKLKYIEKESFMKIYHRKMRFAMSNGFYFILSYMIFVLFFPIENSLKFLAYILRGLLDSKCYLGIRIILNSIFKLDIIDTHEIDVKLLKKYPICGIFYFYYWKNCLKIGDRFEYHRQLNIYNSEVLEPIILQKLPCRSAIEKKSYVDFFLEVISWKIFDPPNPHSLKSLYQLFIHLNMGTAMCNSHPMYWKMNVHLGTLVNYLAQQSPEVLYENFEQLKELRGQNNSNSKTINKEQLFKCFISKQTENNIRFLVKTILYDSENKLQSLLNILNTLSNTSFYISNDVKNSINKIPVEEWLKVCPQLIICLKSQADIVRELVTDIILNIADKYPQILFQFLNIFLHFKQIFFSLLTAESANAPLSGQINNIISIIGEKYPLIIMTIQRFYEDINRIVNGIRKTCKKYLSNLLHHFRDVKNGTFNFKSVSSKLANFENTIEIQPKTIQEKNFLQNYYKKFKDIINRGRFLLDLYDHIINSTPCNENEFLSEAITYSIELHNIIASFESFDTNMTRMNLSEWTLWLLNSDWSHLTVPGHKFWEEEDPKPVYIKSFNPTIKLFSSKRKPCLLTIIGSDDKNYRYIIKSDEDLRLDERIMQFFDLINSKISGCRLLNSKGCKITTYSVIPMTPKFGLINMVDNTESYHRLYKKNRTNEDQFNREMRNMRQYVCDDITLLPTYLYQPIFETAANTTPSDDILSIMRKMSTSIDDWSAKRFTFINSLSVMSIVGYVLGLGDRHTDNILFNLDDFSVIHVDFGDCFDVAALRTNYPETVPFRLSRFIQTAIGSLTPLFRETCIHMLDTLKENQVQILDILASFLLDPLSIETMKIDEQNSLQDTVSGYNDEYQHQNLHRDPDDRFVHVDNQDTSVALEKIRDRLSSDISTDKQVDDLIAEATSYYNLCRLYHGWQPLC